MLNDEFWTYFYEIYEAMPRQGPGDRAATERALKLIPPLTGEHRVLDIGCGTGTQTLDLARATQARIVAVDNHPAFVDRLKERIAALGLGGRVSAQVGDMNDLRFPDGSFDVLWSEGAIFITGFRNGLTSWRRLLPPGGHLVVSEFCWFVPDPAEELVKLLADGCEDVGDAAARREAIAATGYRLLGEFTLPDPGWWDNYYVPLAGILASFRAKYAGNRAALDVADHCQSEIDLWRKHPGAYGYVFFVMRREG